MSIALPKPQEEVAVSAEDLIGEHFDTVDENEESDAAGPIHHLDLSLFTPKERQITRRFSQEFDKLLPSNAKFFLTSLSTFVMCMRLFAGQFLMNDYALLLAGVMPNFDFRKFAEKRRNTYKDGTTAGVLSLFEMAESAQQLSPMSKGKFLGMHTRLFPSANTYTAMTEFNLFPTTTADDAVMMNMLEANLKVLIGYITGTSSYPVKPKGDDLTNALKKKLQDASTTPLTSETKIVDWIVWEKNNNRWDRTYKKLRMGEMLDSLTAMLNALARRINYRAIYPTLDLPPTEKTPDTSGAEVLLVLAGNRTYDRTCDLMHDVQYIVVSDRADLATISSTLDTHVFPYRFNQSRVTDETLFWPRLKIEPDALSQYQKN